MFFRKAFAFIILFFCSLTVSAQWAIKGTVADQESLEPLPGANVYLLNDWETGTSTGFDGTFELISSKAGVATDTVVISFVGFEEQMIAVTEWKDGTVYLKPKNNDLTEVIVESSALVAEEFQYEKINKLDIYTNPAAKADPLLAVNSLPSATPVDESANISLRGGNPGQTGVFFNDVPIYDYVKFSQLNGIGVFSIFNTAIVQSVSVFPGNPPLEYGNVSGGMIAINSDDQISALSTNNLTISPASFGYFRQQKISDKMMLSFFANYQPGGILKAINGEAIRGVESFNLVDGGVYLNARPLKGSVLKIFNYTLSESYQFNFRSPSYNGLFDQKRKRNFTTMKWEQRISERSVLSVNSGVSFTGADFTYSQFDTQTSGTDLFLGINFQHTEEKFELKSGLSSDNRSQEANGSAPVVGYALGADHPSFGFSSENTVRTNEIFTYLKFFPSDKVSIGGGLRTGPDMSGDFYLSRQLNARTEIGESWSLILGGGKYFQAMRRLSSDRDFVRIESDQLSADLKWEPSGMKGSFSLFRIVNSGDPTLDNTITGIEIFFEKNIVDRLTYNISFSYLDYSETPQVIEGQAGNISYFLRGNLNWNFRKRWILGANIL
ncbi:MAG: TonB-dependent receptor, partial [Cyclobacteriaceae bacterium]